MPLKVGYIGLGNMGRPIATNVVSAGYDLMVYDLRQQPMEELAHLGATIAHSAKQVGEHADIVELSVVNDEQVELVVAGPDGVLQGAKPGSIIAIHSTIHPNTAIRMAERARPQGVEVLDAQVSGGQAGAWAKTLCYMVGGEQAAFERCRPVFATSGAHLFYMGRLGMGSATKIAQQMITCVTLLAVSEGFAVARKAGVDLEEFQQLLRVSSAQSGIGDHWLERSGRMGMGTLDLWYQGLSPALALSHELGVAVPGVALTQQLFPRIFGERESPSGS